MIKPFICLAVLLSLMVVSGSAQNNHDLPVVYAKGGQGKNSYTIKNLTNFSPLTAWVEGVADYGIGCFVEVARNNVNTIFNGYKSSSQNWLNNSRVNTFKIYIDNHPHYLLQITDEMGEQRFELPIENDWDASYIFQFEILDVYTGSKWDDLCIPGIENRGCCIVVNGHFNIKTIRALNREESYLMSVFFTPGPNYSKIQLI
jgi:hypothetical protein